MPQHELKKKTTSNNVQYITEPIHRKGDGEMTLSPTGITSINSIINTLNLQY